MKPVSAPPLLTLHPRPRRRIHGAAGEGVSFADFGTKGRMEGCDIAENTGDGVMISHGADPVLSACK